ncbi:MAG TPA: sigma-70 family RNA polymerase sigma factor, partial [Nannocystaceae bacterium]|nr:sigma-70 family RNA polymerase sigma factor [Nannocystaceae bacterium]
MTRPVDHAEDLAFAAACTSGDAAAQARLEGLVRGLSRECAHKLGLAPAECDEVVQRAMVRLLAGATTSATLASYEGRGPLGAWLRVCVAREALMLRRSEGRHETLELSDAIEPVFDPELRLLEAEGRSAVKAAFQAAFERLAPADKVLLAYHFVDGLGMRELGPLFGIDGSNVSRRLARIRSELLAETRRLLSTTRGLGETTIDDVVAMLDGQLD